MSVGVQVGNNPDPALVNATESVGLKWGDGR